MIIDGNGEIVPTEVVDKEKRFTGRYHNGKKVYSKYIEQEIPNQGVTSLVHNLNIDEYVEVEAKGYVYDQKTSIRPIPYYDGSGRIWLQTYSENAINVTSSWAYNKVFITIYFTENK